MALFKSKPSEDKVLEIFNALSSEQKEAVKSKLLGADKPATEVVPEEKKADDLVDPKIEEPKADETLSEETEVEETSTEDKAGEDKSDGAEQEPQKSYEELLKELLAEQMEQVNKKLDSIDQKYSERLENLDKKPDKKGFGMAESSKEYKATYTPEETSDDIIKKIFN